MDDNLNKLLSWPWSVSVVAVTLISPVNEARLQFCEDGFCPSSEDDFFPPLLLTCAIMVFEMRVYEATV